MSNRTGINANPNVGIGSHVRGHQFRAGIIVRYERGTGFPVVHFNGEPHPYAVHPAQLISEVDYLKLVGQPTAAEMVPALGEWVNPAEGVAHANAIHAILNG